jgi:glycosyltransferase involved in cell wall biosynthesis
MKIKVGTYIFFPGGGIGRYTKDLLEEMASFKEIDVHLICSDNFEWQEINGVKVHPVLMKLHHTFPLIRKMRFLIAQLVSPWNLIKHVENKSYDWIHFASFNHLSYPLWSNALKKKGVKIAITAHDILRLKPVFSTSWEDKQLKNCYRFADAIFVHSNSQAEELNLFADVPMNKIHVVPHGAYLYANPTKSRKELKKEFGISEDQKVALFFGQIRDEKHLEYFLHALKNQQNTFGIIAGSLVPRHKSGQFYQELIKELQIEDRVHFDQGYIPEELVGNYFSVADYTVFPYDDRFSSQSGVLNIAAHYKVPVIVSQAPVLKETVENSNIGIVMKRTSVEGLVDSMKEMEEKLNIAYVFDLDSYNEKYSWKENAKKTIEVYKAALN